MSVRHDITTLRAAIVAQADAMGAEGWTTIPVPTVVAHSGVLRMPRGAFERWSTWRSGGEHLVTPWERVSPQGVKQGGDDAYHTDWMLGAGLAPNDMRPDGDPRHEALRAAAEDARHAFARRVLGHAATVLLSGPSVTGIAWHPSTPDDRPPDRDDPPVAILRDARPDWLAVVAACIDAGGGAVIERGGEMAHLVSELRGTDRGPLLRVPDARRLFPDGTPLTLTPACGEVSLRDDGRSPDASRASRRFLVEDVRIPKEATEPEVRPPVVGTLAVEGTDILLEPFDQVHARLVGSLDYVMGGRRIVGDRWSSYGVLHASSPTSHTQHLVVTLHSEAARGDAGARYSAGRREWLGSIPLLDAAVDAPLAILEADLRREGRARHESRLQAREAARGAEEERLLTMPEAALLAEAQALLADEAAYHAEPTTWSLDEVMPLLADYEASWQRLLEAASRRGIDLPPRPSPCEQEGGGAPWLR